MKRSRLTLANATLLACCLAASSIAAAELHDVIFRDAAVVDVETGELRNDQLIAIDGDTISYIGADDADEHEGREAINAAGRYAIPGLWDMHVHIEGTNLVEDNLLLFPVYLAYGITTVRDMASDLGEQVLDWRDAIDAGELQGPRIYTAGRKIEGIDSVWKGDLEVASEAEMRDMMDLLDDASVDFVKVTENTLSADLFLATVREARRRGFRVSGHVPYDTTIEILASAGLSSIEHASYLLRLGSADEADIAAQVQSGTMSKSEAGQHYLASFNQDEARRGYRALTKHDIYVTPTLIGGRQMAWFDENDHADDEFRRYLTRSFMAPYAPRAERAANATPGQQQERKARFRRLAAQMPLLVEAGVTLIAGSDSAPIAAYVYPALGLHEEMQILQEAGLTAPQVLQAATINGARFLGKDAIAGTLAAGKVADIVLLTENPLQDIAATLAIDTVVVRGEVFPRAALDEMLEQAARQRLALDRSREQLE